VSESLALADLRFGLAPLPDPSPGFEPAGDAKALAPAGFASPAREPVPGKQLFGSLGPGQRFVVRVPTRWNGGLVVAGTPSTRCEFANDAIWGDLVLARGYAFACGNKRIPYNAIVEDAARTPAPSTAYPVPFDVLGLTSGAKVVRFGALHPRRVSIAEWNEDFVETVLAAKDAVASMAGVPPERTYVVGLSNGGAQVRWLLENRPELVDGGVEWAAVRWSSEASFLDYLPTFLRHMPAYVRSGFSDRDAHDAIAAAGLPPDRRQSDPAHPSLWLDHYSNVPPFYGDMTTFLYALLVDGAASSSFALPPCVPNAVDPQRLPGACQGTGLALPQNRAAYRPSGAARREIARFAHTGRIRRPLFGIAGDADMLIAPGANALAYKDAVRLAGRGRLYRLYVVDGGTHVDSFAAFGYGLQPQLPFAWAAFDQMVAVVERGFDPGDSGQAHAVARPDQIESR
jgi:hypothetical protein